MSRRSGRRRVYRVVPGLAVSSSRVRDAFPAADDPAALAIAMWALVHGLAFLHLDGKLDSATPDDRVRAAVHSLRPA
jgi:hypothetical protein